MKWPYSFALKCVNLRDLCQRVCVCMFNTAQNTSNEHKLDSVGKCQMNASIFQPRFFSTSRNEYAFWLFGICTSASVHYHLSDVGITTTTTTIECEISKNVCIH